MKKVKKHQEERPENATETETKSSFIFPRKSSKERLRIKIVYVVLVQEN